jgi:hypothetical protein
MSLAAVCPTRIPFIDVVLSFLDGYRPAAEHPLPVSFPVQPLVRKPPQPEIPKPISAVPPPLKVRQASTLPPFNFSPLHREIIRVVGQRYIHFSTIAAELSRPMNREVVQAAVEELVTAGRLLSKADRADRGQNIYRLALGGNHV